MMEAMNFPLAIRDMMITESRDTAGVSVMGEDEFRSFYERTARPLWSYLSRITGDRQKADDLLQEAYYRFYRAGAKYESEAHRRNSLFHIATNLVRDAARRSRHYEEVSLEQKSEEGLAPKSMTGSPEDHASVRTDVARAMKKLEPMQREILWLAYAQGESHEEIARIVGVRPISVRTLLFRARKKLAAVLRGGEQ
ncbi:MAG TPA: RNA polymerase sigma factor [Thermoanaerobaculia bacterium]